MLAYYTANYLYDWMDTCTFLFIILQILPSYLHWSPTFSMIATLSHSLTQEFLFPWTLVHIIFTIYLNIHIFYWLLEWQWFPLICFWEFIRKEDLKDTGWTLLEYAHYIIKWRCHKVKVLYIALIIWVQLGQISLGLSCTVNLSYHHALLFHNSPRMFNLVSPDTFIDFN